MNEEALKGITDWATQNGPTYLIKLLGAVAVWIIGGWIAKRVANALNRQMERRRTDETLRPFLYSLILWSLKLMVGIAAITTLGVQATSFVAVLGAAGLAVGMALQGSLGNFAGGVLLMIFKPFKVGDLIEAQGFTGVVQELQIFATVLATPENKKVVIPNGPLAGGPMVNYTERGLIRVDTEIGIAYDADIKAARDALMKVMKSNDKILSEPSPSVNVLALGDNAVNLAVRPFCKPEHYWDVFFYTLEEGKNALDAQNIGIPFPQMDVHMIKE